MIGHSTVKFDPIGFGEKCHAEFHFLHLIEEDGSQKRIQFSYLQRVRFRSNLPPERIHEVLIVHGSEWKPTGPSFWEQAGKYCTNGSVVHPKPAHSFDWKLFFKNMRGGIIIMVLWIAGDALRHDSMGVLTAILTGIAASVACFLWVRYEHGTHFSSV